MRVRCSELVVQVCILLSHFVSVRVLLSRLAGVLIASTWRMQILGCRSQTQSIRLQVELPCPDRSCPRQGFFRRARSRRGRLADPGTGRCLGRFGRRPRFIRLQRHSVCLPM